jgi:hypothetical protein
MGSWRTERRLTQVATRLRALREELAIIDEQLAQLVDEAEDLALRALMSETPSSNQESNDARKHVDAMRRHRTTSSPRSPSWRSARTSSSIG